ncbi:hypothetical protein Tco_0109522 [Tanacetum coccineum]
MDQRTTHIELSSWKSNPSHSNKTTAATDPENVYFRAHGELLNRRNIKEAMADSLQVSKQCRINFIMYDRLKSGNNHKPFGKMIYKAKSGCMEEQKDEPLLSDSEAFGFLFAHAAHKGDEILFRTQTPPVPQKLDALMTRKALSGGDTVRFGDKQVSWMSKETNCTAMSSAEASYMTLSASCLK